MLSRHRCWRTPPETSSARRNRTTAHPSFSRSAAAKEGPAPCLCSCPASAMQSLQLIEIEPSAVFQPCHWEDSSSCKLWEVITMQRSGFEPRQAATREIGVLGRCSLRLSPAYGTSLASLPDLKLIAFHCQSQLAILFCGLRPLLKHEHPTKNSLRVHSSDPAKGEILHGLGDHHAASRGSAVCGTHSKACCRAQSCPDPNIANHCKSRTIGYCTQVRSATHYPSRQSNQPAICIRGAVIISLL